MFYIFIAGGLGSLCRYLLSILIPMESHLSIGIINALGCFLFGLLMPFIQAHFPHTQNMIFTGFLGGFTTFSTWQWHTLTLYQQQPFYAIAYTFGSLFLCIVAMYLGTILISSIYTK